MKENNTTVILDDQKKVYEQYEKESVREYVSWAADIINNFSGG